ncbi:MAG: thiolase domain-containing protein [Anaerolineaceae bacterium]|jgi:acetyl-CoA C-acetyltransferase|nr:thiolase domain-containing protein [Anaerolineaceae bacterium]MDD4041947.1 thiolase domain-containing protein [Anaerolineaceae bacterium]MDD4578526.1 thiolase domain-containing protein [Anaerolineaceae bacterium]
MNKVYIAGIGQTPVSESWDKSLKELAGDAGLMAMNDAGIGYPDALFVGNMMAITANRQAQLGTLMADWLGFHQKPAISVETACSSGSAAFRMALMAIASGELESVLVIGAEKMTDSPGDEITASLATAADAELETDFGLSFVGLNALLMRRYMYEYGWEHKDFANFSINAHANAMHNPNARFQEPISIESFKKSPMISDPINLMDASPVSDGAAAIVLSAHPIRNGHKGVSVIASSSMTDTLSLQNRKVGTRLTAAETSAKTAFAQAGLQPEDMGLFEYHDAFSIMAALSLEAAGFCAPGEGPKMAIEGRIKIDAEIPVATMGGLKARGHPVGATGIYQLVEATLQLRGIAGANQVSRPKYALTQNIGGSGSNIVTHILQAE